MNPTGANEQLASANEVSLVALAMSGDDAAYEELVRRRQGAIRRLMRQLSGDWAIADDLAQEAFLRAWQKLRTLRSPGTFGGWLRRIAVNVFLQHVRRKSLKTEDFTEREPNLKTREGDPTVRMDLERALELLRPVERLCVVLAHGERLSHGEVSSVTGLPLGTVKSHISRGTARLRATLKEYGSGI